MSIKIALCDDETVQLTQTEVFLKEYRSRRPGMDFRVTSFTASAALLEHLRAKGAFDLYFLDVIMPGENGIELGLNIREYDKGGRIVYLSASPDFAVDSYRAKATDYLLKPLNKTQLFQTLDNILEDLSRESKLFAMIKAKDGYRRVAHSAIVYGELAGRCVQYHLADGSVIEGTSLRGSFQNAVGFLLEQQRFILCATSFFVNLSFVERVDSSNLRLAGGGTIPLSRSLRTEVTNRWLDYHLEGGG